MTLFYVDASAWAKLLVEEAESEVMHAWVNERLASADEFVSSHLLVTELGRLAQRAGVEAVSVTSVLKVLSLVLPSIGTYTAAGLLPGAVRSLDAIHVAAALGVGADHFVTYDERQREAAEAAGIPVVVPAA